MDKLELDARVARLESRVAILMFLLLTSAPAIAIATLYGIRRGAVAPPPPLPSPPPASMTVGLRPVEVSHNTPTNRIKDLDREIRKVRQMQLQGWITGSDFAAKKAKLLDRPLTVGNSEEDMQVASQLKSEGFVTPTEYEVIKQKILAEDG